jgi:hypothetical protein
VEQRYRANKYSFNKSNKTGCIQAGKHLKTIKAQAGTKSKI